MVSKCAVKCVGFDVLRRLNVGKITGSLSQLNAEGEGFAVWREGRGNQRRCGRKGILKQWPNVLTQGMCVGDSQLKNTRRSEDSSLFSFLFSALWSFTGWWEFGAFGQQLEWLRLTSWGMWLMLYLLNYGVSVLFCGVCRCRRVSWPAVSRPGFVLQRSGIFPVPVPTRIPWRWFPVPPSKW